MRLRAGFFIAAMFPATLAFCHPLSATAQTSPQQPVEAALPESAPSPMGSLAATGGVEVNGAPVSAQSTVYPGDSITTHDDGTATLTLSNQGKLELAPVTQVVFSDGSRYAAQLNLGALTFDMFPGSNLAVRTGDYLVTVAPDSLADTSATLRRTSDGSALVSCDKGRVQVVALEGDTSLALQAGQSTSLAAESSEITAVVASDPVVAVAAGTVKHHRLRTVLIIAGAAAAATAIAVVAADHGGNPPKAASANPPPSNPPAPNRPIVNPPITNPPISNPPAPNPPSGGGSGGGGGNGSGHKH